MGMYCDEAAGDRLIDGIEGGVAMHPHGRDHVEVWCEDAESHFGNLPATWTVEQINAAIGFYRAGEKAGMRLGEIRLQHEIRSSLKLVGVDLDAVAARIGVAATKGPANASNVSAETAAWSTP